MAITLNKLYVKAFEDRLRHLAQQTDCRLRPWVQERGDTGSSVTWPRMGKQSMAIKGARAVVQAAATSLGVTVQSGVPTPINDSVFSNRVSALATYHGGDATEQEDINQLLVDPNSAIATSLAAAARRQTDTIIMTAALGTAADETGATTALPGGQVIGDYSKEIDFEQVTAVNEKFLSNDIPADEEKVFVVGPKQARKLLHLAQATQTWYVEAKQLVSGGYIRNWMGFTWILSNLLNAPDGTSLDCFAMTRRAIGLHVSRDLWTRVAEDPSISFAWRIYTAMTMGAVRIEDAHVVQFKAKNTFTVPA